MDNLILAMKFSESDKKITIILIVLLLLVIIICGYLQKLVGYIMRYQGLQVDTMMYNIIKTKTIDDRKTFKKEAYRKSMVLFTKKSWIPFIITVLMVFAILIYGWCTQDNSCSYYTKAWYDLSYKIEWPTTKFFGLTLICDWPKVIAPPDYSYNFGKYYALVITIIGSISGLFYLYQVQCYLSRCLRIRQLSRKYFTKQLVNPDADKGEQN